MKDTSDAGRTTALSDRVRSLRLGNRDAGRPSRTRWLPWIVSLVLLLTTAAFGYRAYRVTPIVVSGDAPAAARKVDAPANGSAPAAPTTSVASSGDVVLQAKGYVIPISQVQVSPKVGGQLVWINPNFEEGRKFNKDEVLARIDKDEFQTEHDQAKAAYEAACQRYEELKKTLPEEVQQAEADLEESRQNLTQLKLDLDRSRRLVGGALTQRELEQTKYAYEANLARVRKLEASLRMIKEGRLSTRLRASEFERDQAKATLDKAALRLGYTNVQAPVSGTILSKKAELGNIVNPSAFSSGISASLCEMADLTKLEIDLKIQERDIASVKVGQDCIVMPEAYEKDAEFRRRHPDGYRGRVSRLMPTADRSQGAIPVRVRIEDGEIPEAEAGIYLRPDMGALVSFKKADEKKSPSAATNTASK
ncbi:MAG: efflux RND transporter periplasmic adaptor subunit [Gemmataceae bacterium]